MSVPFLALAATFWILGILWFVGASKFDGPDRTMFASASVVAAIATGLCLSHGLGLF